MFIVVAAVETNVIFPAGVPVAAAVVLMYIVVVLTIPLDGVNVKELAKAAFDDNETSNPAGGVTVILADKIDPETVKD
jgi:hypothetical protein